MARLVDLDNIAFSLIDAALTDRVNLILNSPLEIHWFCNSATLTLLYPDVLAIVRKNLHVVDNEPDAADIALIEFAVNKKSIIEVVTNDRALMRVFALLGLKSVFFSFFDTGLLIVDPPPLFSFRNSFEIDKFIAMVEKMPWLLSKPKWGMSTIKSPSSPSPRTTRRAPRRSSKSSRP